MPTPKQVYEEYLLHFDEYQNASERYQELIRGVLANANIELRSMEGRAKEPLSLYTKQKDKQYENPWIECSDLMGVRLIVPLARDKNRIVEALKDADNLRVLDVDFKEEYRDPKSLKYGGLHVQVVLDDIAAPLGVPITCEIQIRTIAEHAWAETEHEYIYKGPDGIPNSTRRIFARLLALIELVDDELNRGVESVAELESFARHHLIKFLEKAYEVFSTAAPSASMTVHHVHALLEAGNYDPSELEGMVTQFVATHEEQIHVLVAEHGPSSPQFDIDEHIVVAQPELLLVLALLENNAFDLSNAVRNTDLFRLIKPVALWRNVSSFMIV